MSARIPPSQSLSTRLTKDTYLMVVSAISVQTTSDSAPSVAVGSGLVPVKQRTDLSVTPVLI
jgi:hypothetical protein